MSKKQRSERLFTAFGDIDDRYVDEALEKPSVDPFSAALLPSPLASQLSSASLCISLSR